MELMDNPIRRYAWGSRTTIASLQGRAVPSPHPEAELWLGAHPADPSSLLAPGGCRVSLGAELSESPESRLGYASVSRWGSRLPFLLKVLAVDEPLSLQAHPGASNAAAGFAREETAGLPAGHPRRNYKDMHHKPELVCALTEFHALTGFRAPDRTLRLLAELDVPELGPYLRLLASQPDRDGLRLLFTTWLTLPQRLVDQLAQAVHQGCLRLVRQPGTRAFATEARTVAELIERYPGDAGALAALLLNRVTLAPGQALYTGAGVLHAYLFGTGIEVMASSDNVLRGGLTPKHVDIAELLRILDFEPGPPAIITGQVDGVLTRYDTVAEEFRLWRLDWTEATVGDTAPLPGCGARILLCTEGEARVFAATGQSLDLRRGDSLWLDARDGGVKVASARAPSQLFLAADGLD